MVGCGVEMCKYTMKWSVHVSGVLWLNFTFSLEEKIGSRVCPVLYIWPWVSPVFSGLSSSSVEFWSMRSSRWNLRSPRRMKSYEL